MMKPSGSGLGNGLFFGGAIPTDSLCLSTSGRKDRIGFRKIHDELLFRHFGLDQRNTARLMQNSNSQRNVKRWEN